MENATVVATIDKKQNLGELVKQYYSQLKGFIRKRVNSNEDAEDIVQDVFYQFSKVDSLMNPIENVAAWLYRVARNQIIDQGKKKKTTELPVQTDEDGELYTGLVDILLNDDNTPETEYLRSLVMDELEEALGELPEEQREVFELNEMQGISFKEISEETGTPVNTLISRKRYAVLHLRERLKDLYYDLIYQ